MTYLKVCPRRKAANGTAFFPKSLYDVQNARVDVPLDLGQGIQALHDFWHVAILERCDLSIGHTTNGLTFAW